ncbi:MAG: transcriptional regulator [Candidatus Heimdallarchaeaceae archaeon]|jgi:DNA-binding MarR family transcriptional regulator
MASRKTKITEESELPFDEVVSIDGIIHSPPRLAIMMFLLPRRNATFASIQKALDFTSGNLTTHLSKLESNNMVEIQKGIVDAKPTTIVYLTEFGRTKLKEYARILTDILKGMLEKS